MRKRSEEIQENDLWWFFRFKRTKIEELIEQMAYSRKLKTRSFPVFHNAFFTVVVRSELKKQSILLKIYEHD